MKEIRKEILDLLELDKVTQILAIRQKGVDMEKPKKLSDLHKIAKKYGEIDDYMHSEQYVKNCESKREDKEGFIKLVREYAILKKGFSVFEESDTKFENVSIELLLDEKLRNHKK